MNQIYTIKFVGPAGMGIKTSGLLFSQMLVTHGFNFIDYSEYPSLVRGGHNTYQISFSKDKIFSVYRKIDLLLSLLPGHEKEHLLELKDTGLLITEFKLNTAAIGAAAYIFNLQLNSCLDIISHRFGSDSPNIISFREGWDYARDHHQQLISSNNLLSKDTCKLKIMDGNEAFGWGFIDGDGKFYAAYPMTPATGALHFLAQKQSEYNLTVVHPEDEIAASSLATGASYAGVKSAVGTSGGGFALMNETISFNGVAEIGVVYYLVSRPGPATGMPTWTAQADILHAVFSGHGEFPIVVLSAGDQIESYELAIESLNLASKFQIPVILLSDKLIGESCASIDKFPKIKIQNSDTVHHPINFKRYADTKSGISPLTIPGTKGGEFLANSYEHDELGFSTEDSKTAVLMADKRSRKNQAVLKHLPKPIFYGQSKDNLIISTGSAKGVILESLKDPKLAKSFSFLHLKTIWPLDTQIEYLIKPFKNVYILENNQSGQLTTLLKMAFSVNPKAVIKKYDGRPLFPEELKDILVSYLERK